MQNLSPSADGSFFVKEAPYGIILRPDELTARFLNVDSSKGFTVNLRKATDGFLHGSDKFKYHIFIFDETSGLWHYEYGYLPQPAKPADVVPEAKSKN